MKKERNIALAVCAVLAALILLLTSQSSPLYPINLWGDANCLFTVGRVMKDGGVLSVSYTHLDVTINDIQAVACYDSENDIYALAALDSEGTGMFVFYFQPASDDTMTQIADVIVASLSPIE